ncbi:Vacuolar protein sorting-associated protein 13 [Massospora cicadina]|nr:Vacuolar protein sorting-associated protein 13 [Massospora cicadina]
MFESVIANVLNKFLGDYVENFQSNQLNIAIWNGDVKLKNLRLKKEALYKLRLPLEFREGFLGELTLKIPWHNLKNLPVRVIISNVYLLISPKDEVDLDPKEEEEKAQRLKLKKLETFELLKTKENLETQEDSLKNASFTNQLITKIVDNLQVSIKNIHLRYEDNLSNDSQPFAIGLTLSEISAISTDENWQQALTNQSSEIIRKLLTLKSLSVYWDTDARSLGGKPIDEAINIFMDEIPKADGHSQHQFVLKPVSASGKLVLNQIYQQDKPKATAGLNFDEISFSLDDEQTRDLMLAATRFDFVMRKQNYVQHHPPRHLSYKAGAKDWFRFAIRCVLNEIHARHRQWTWEYFAERRDDRKRYIDLYTKVQLDAADGVEVETFEALERKLKFRDLKFYRSLAQPEISRQKKALKMREEAAAKSNTSWFGSMLGWSGAPPSVPEDNTTLSDEQLKNLYSTIDYDEEMALRPTDFPRDYVTFALKAQLEKASLTLKTRPHGNAQDLLTLGLKSFEVDFLQRPDSYKAKVNLSGLELIDGTSPDSLYPHLVKVSEPYMEERNSPGEPFFALTYEHNPLDGRSDDAVAVKMLNLQVFYKPKILDTLKGFFKPPTPATDAVSALIEAAGTRFEGLKKQTTASLQYALEDHRTLDVHVDIHAPLFIVPHSFTDPTAAVVVLDSGHITVVSDMVDKNKKNELQSKQNHSFTDQDFLELESLMYDKLNIELTSVQLVVGCGVEECLVAVQPSTPAGDLHVLDRINMKLDMFLSILPQVSHFTKLRVAGCLPQVAVNISTQKYKALMTTLDLLLPADTEASTEGLAPPRPTDRSPKPEPTKPILFQEDASEEVYDEDDEFYDAEDDTQLQIEATHKNLNAKLFEIDFAIDKLKVSLRKADDAEISDAHLDGFKLHLASHPFHMTVGVDIQRLTMFDKVFPDSEMCHVITSALTRPGDSPKALMRLDYTRVNPDSPEFESRFDGITQFVDATFSTVDIYVTPKTILELYYFLLATFFADEPAPPPLANASAGQVPSLAQGNTKGNTTQVRARMETMSLILNDNGTPLATISLVDGDLTLLVTQATLRLATRLGNIAVQPAGEGPPLLTTDGHEAAELRYESFSNPVRDLGYDTLFNANIGAARLMLLEDPISSLMSFFSRFAEMQGLFESARLAALNSASQLQEQVSRLQFEVLMKSPKLLLPRSDLSKDFLTANLGELRLRNSFLRKPYLINAICLKLSSIFLSSSIEFSDFRQELEILQNMDLAIDLNVMNDDAGSSTPAKEMAVSLSPVAINVTRGQYRLLLDVFNRVVRLSGSSTSEPPLPPPRSPKSQPPERTLSTVASAKAHLTLEITFTLEKLLLEIYNGENPKGLEASKLAKVSLNNTHLKYRCKSDGQYEVEAEIHSFVVLDCRTDFDYPFREIIPAITHEGPQFMAQLTTPNDGASTLLVTVDGPKVIFALDYLLALKDFALSPFGRTDELMAPSSAPSAPVADALPLTYRVNVIDAELIVLADLRNPSTEAIVLSIRQVLLSQQGIFALTVNQVGMCLCQMNQRETTSLRFIETFDVVLSMDDRVAKPGHRLTNIAVDVKPLILRLSYRDVMLISDIVNKFSQLTYISDAAGDAVLPVEAPNRSSEGLGHSRTTSLTDGFTRQASNSTYYQVVSRETMRLTVQGLRILLIRDAYDLPILDLSTEPFIVDVLDWSNQLKAELHMAMRVNFYNLKNSHWEPLVEPWSFSVAITKPERDVFATEFQSKRLMDINVTPAIIETAMSFMEEIQSNNPLTSARGVHVPFLLRNRTGYAMHVWGDNNLDSEEVALQRIPDGEDVPWRFDDWRKMRESFIQSRNSLGLQFENVAWESVKDILVDQAGISIYTLRPLLNGVAHRLVCEVQLEDNVKVVTFRSPLLIHNATLLPLEMVVVDTNRKYLCSPTSIPPGDRCAVPIKFAYRYGLLIRPTSGFGYGWSTHYLYWREFLVSTPMDSVVCPADDPDDPAFHIQVHGQFHVKDPVVANYPNLTFRLSAPLELENLLPYDIRFKVYDAAGIEWPSFLKRGGVSPVHMVNVKHKLGLSLEVCDTNYRPSARVPIHVPSRPSDNPARYITLRDPNDLELNLQTTLMVAPGSGGSLKVSVFSPYVLLNKTGLDMFFKTQSITRQSKIASGQGTRSSSKVSPFMFSYGRNEPRKRALVKVGPSDWSHPVSFEATGSASELVLKVPERSESIHLGVSIEEGAGKYRVTKLVTFTPRYIVKNNMAATINFRVFASSHSAMVSPNERAPLYYLSPRDGELLTICYPGLNNLWSAPFKINTVGKVHVLLGRSDGGIDLVRAEVILQGATIFIALEKEEGKWPYRIENLSETDVVFHQTTDPAKNPAGHKEPNKYKLAAGMAVPYSWDFPAMAEKSLTLIAGSERRIINFQQIGAMEPLKLKLHRKSVVIALDVIADGPTQILRLSKYIEAESLFRPTRAMIHRNLSGSNLGASLNECAGTSYGFEVVEKDTRVTFSFTLRLEGVGVSLINRREQELVYATLRELDLRFNDYTDSQSINLKIKWIQMDNMLYEALFPIVLYPTVISRSGNETNLHPTLQIVATRTKDASTVEMFKYFTFLLQEISLEIDEDFLFALMDFAKYSLPSAETAEATQLYDGQLEIPEPAPPFLRTEHINQEEVQPSSNNPFTLLVDVLTMAIGNINDAPIKFNSLVLENLLADYTVLMDRLTSYYGQEFVYQIHKIVGSVDVLGNPVGLFTNLSSGVVDIFYEPYQGIVMSDRPQDFGIGLARGTASFVKKTVFGVTDSFSKITDSLGKGLAEMTMDRAFIDRRRLSKSRNRPKHALYGVASGANSLGSSMASGFTGVVTQPMEGAERDGVGGFFSGLGKGLVGVVAKPIVGAFDLVSHVAEGIRNTTTVFDGDPIDRVRLPRYIGPDGILKPYSQRESLGQKWLHDFKDGKYAHENYLAHYDLGNAQTAILLTGSRVIQIRLRNLSLEWEMPFSELQSVHIDAAGISFVAKHDILGPFIPIQDATSRRWFAARIDEAFDKFLNSQRSLD